MPRPSDIDETASRADDKKDITEEPGDHRGTGSGDGKDEEVPQGGKRRGPGRWIDPGTSGD